MILDLKKRNEEGASNYDHVRRELNESILEKGTSRSKNNSRFDKKKDSKDKTLTFDTSYVLKQRLIKITHSNKEKIKLIETYQRNIKVIDEAFDTIKEATGLTDIE